MTDCLRDCLPPRPQLATALLAMPPERLRTHCFLTPGLPVKVMLGKAAKSFEQIVTKFEGRRFSLEYKYDGERAQIHLLEDGRIVIYSRNLENNTGKYPDIIQALPRVLAPGVKSAILDAEVVAWDPVHKAILPFQTLSTRKRKDVATESVTVQVVLFGFDLLYLNGVSYMKKPFQVRGPGYPSHGRTECFVTAPLG